MSDYDRHTGEGYHSALSALLHDEWLDAQREHYDEAHEQHITLILQRPHPSDDEIDEVVDFWERKGDDAIDGLDEARVDALLAEQAARRTTRLPQAPRAA